MSTGLATTALFPRTTISLWKFWVLDHDTDQLLVAEILAVSLVNGLPCEKVGSAPAIMVSGLLSVHSRYGLPSCLI